MSKSKCSNSAKILLWRGICLILALATIVCGVGWVVTARRQTCIGITEAEITHCETADGKCYFYVLTDDFISRAVEIPEDKYGMYVEGDVILVDVIANHKGEKSLYFSKENA